MFSTLFSNPDVLREVYSAIEGVDIPSDAIIEINTLSDVLYMQQINDLSFTIDDRIVVLIEHQSTINDNVPVRHNIINLREKKGKSPYNGKGGYEHK